LFSLQAAISVVQYLGVQQAALKEKDLAITDLQSKLEEFAVRREIDEKLTKLYAVLD